MRNPTPFALTARLLAAHGYAGRVLALPPSALGGMVQLLAERPGPSVAWALQGRRADSQVWAPLVARVKASGPSCESCGGGGTCAQCKGIGCAACSMSGKCSVCDGAGKLAPADDDDPDSEPDSDEGDDSSSSAMSSGIVRVVKVRGVLAAEVTPWECGVMDGYQGPGGIVERWRAAHADPACVAVVLDAMAPGGDALLCMESSQDLADITAASGKPAAVFASEATSAMYALACGAASKGLFFVAPSADVANVGTRTWHVDYSAQNKMDGMVVTHFGDPPGKILGNPDEPLDPEAKARIEKSIAESTARFSAFVAERRGLSVAAVREADARCLRGADAVAQGFADAVVGSLADAVALASTASLKLAPPLTPAGVTGDEDDMPLTPAALAALGLSPGAKSVDVSAAILAARPMATLEVGAASSALEALGAVTLEAMGGGDPMDALVLVPRQLRAAAAAPATAARADTAERELAWSDAVTAGTFAAGEVWTPITNSDGSRGKAFTAMATQFNAAYPDVTKLVTRLDKLPKLARSIVSHEADADVAAAADAQRATLGLSPKWQALAAKSGVNPASLAARAAVNLQTLAEPR